MNYTQKLVLSMLVPTVMVAGAGSAVVVGAWWLQGQAAQQSGATLVEYLSIGAKLTAMLTLFCVAACLGFTVWIRRTALQTLGGDPSTAQQALAQLADGNLMVRIEATHPGSLMHSLTRLADTLRTSLSQINDASQAIGLASGDIAKGNQALHTRTEQTSENLRTTAANMHQLNEVVQHSVESARQASTLAANAADVASHGGQVMAEVVRTMEEINSSSQKISEIIGVIDGIAFQTNILALNAAVEAARAGEQGRGFAVVASEVRNLASRSANAAREIKQLINDSVTRIHSGAQQVQGAGGTMDEIMTSVKQVSDIIGEITAATTEESQEIAQINAAIADLDAMTQQNAELVKQSSSAATNLYGQTHNLADVVANFRVSEGPQSLSPGLNFSPHK